MTLSKIKSFLVAGAILTLNLSAEARPVVVVDPSIVIKVKVGSGNDDLNQRVNRLEMAVQQLQEKIFEISYQQAPRVTWYCSISFPKNVKGLGASKGEALLNLQAGCAAQGVADMFCSDDDAKCSNQ